MHELRTLIQTFKYRAKYKLSVQNKFQDKPLCR